MAINDNVSQLYSSMNTPVCAMSSAGERFYRCSLAPGHTTAHAGFRGHNLTDRVVWWGPWEDGSEWEDLSETPSIVAGEAGAAIIALTSDSITRLVDRIINRDNESDQATSSQIVGRRVNKIPQWRAGEDLPDE